MRIMSQDGNRIVAGPPLNIHYRITVSSAKIAKVPNHKIPRHPYSQKIDRTALYHQQGEAICDFEVYVNDEYFGTLDTRREADAFMDLVLECDPDARLRVPQYASRSHQQEKEEE